MTAYALMPTFTDREGYLQWLGQWSYIYNKLSRQIRQHKDEIKKLNNIFSLTKENEKQLADAQKNLIHHRAVALKMMTLRKEAKIRRDRIISMQKEIMEQPFPLTLENCKNVDFHYNKGHTEFGFLPMWTIRVKGKSYYVKVVDAEISWTTRERNSGSTKGVIRISRCNVSIDGDGNARLY